MKKMKTAISCSIITIFLLAAFIPVSYAQSEEEGSLEVFVTFSTSGKRVSPNEMVAKVYQDFDKTPIQEIDVNSNPFLLTLPIGHSYKVEIYTHSIFSSFGLLKMEEPKQNLDMTVFGTGGLEIYVLYNDRVTPISNATIEITAFDGNLFTKTSTFLYGETPRMFLPITSKDTDYFYVDIKITENITKRISPVTIYRGTQELKIITDWPPIIESLFTVKILDGPDSKFTGQKNYFVNMVDKDGIIVKKSYLTTKGEAYFSNFKVNDYDLVLKRVTPSGIEEIASKSVTLIGQRSEVELIINDPEQDTTNISVPFEEEEEPDKGKVISIPFKEEEDSEQDTTISVPLMDEEPEENKNCNCAAFRLSNVQDFYLNNVQISLIDLFDSKDSSLTIGITGDSIGEDSKIVDAVNEKILKKNLLVANLGWKKVDFTSLSEQEQYDSISDTNAKILEVFGLRSTIFIAPYSKFNEDTIRAVQANGMTYFSSTTSSDPPPYNFQNSIPIHLPYTLPIKNVIASESVEIQGNVDEKLQLILDDFDDFGFAVINMQSQDFAQKEDGFQNLVDLEKLLDLELLIDSLHKTGIEIVPFDEIPGLMTPITSPPWVDRIYTMYEKGQINQNDLIKALDYLVFKKII